ncbi:Nuclear factor of activated T-cells, cytoplasmic 1 [Liparis tanakae]|uniref:Nuclear factor of activated T-cells, cytoplasmic 1 n=1 Tax=Liparis tanakae TaxID=230148 RepID=A0A4Z2HVA8_9TELE|nr:Nuclear factor of activated T-cells, cytoplasmic 1 [Liparis tanakae]
MQCSPHVVSSWATGQTCLLVEIPPYRSQRLSTPVHVNFYVCNGKRKRSQYQRFTYSPASVQRLETRVEAGRGRCLNREPVAKLNINTAQQLKSPTIKTEPRDDFDGPLACGQRGPSKPYFPPPAVTPSVTSDLRPCVGGGPHKPSLPPASSSPSASPKLSPPQPPPPFSKSLAAGPPPPPPSHASIIHEAPGRHQPLGSYPPSGSSSSSSPTTSQPSTPTDGPFSPDACGSPEVEERAEAPPRGRGSRPPAVSIKQEPQELDQMYLDDVNEIIRNDLSSISVHSQA